MNNIRLWREWLESLNTSGGHILVLALGILFGAVLLHKGMAEGKEVLIGASAALLAILRPSAPTS